MDVGVQSSFVCPALFILCCGLTWPLSWSSHLLPWEGLSKGGGECVGVSESSQGPWWPAFRHTVLLGSQSQYGEMLTPLIPGFLQKPAGYSQWLTERASRDRKHPNTGPGWCPSLQESLSEGTLTFLRDTGEMGNVMGCSWNRASGPISGRWTFYKMSAAYSSRGCLLKFFPPGFPATHSNISLLLLWPAFVCLSDSASSPENARFFFCISHDLGFLEISWYLEVIVSLTTPLFKK
jgi:hypothetical protein